MEKPLVSIITPLHNAGSFIGDTIESVLSQTYSQFEMLVVNDGSVDNGVEIVERYCESDPRIKLFHNDSNLGPAKTRNKAISYAKGRFIAFLDSDDLWYADKLEIQVSKMMESDIPFAFSSYDRMDENGEDLGPVLAPPKVCYADLLKTCSIGCLTAIYDAEALGKVYLPDILKRQDFALWLKILKLTPEAMGIEKVLAKYRVRNNSISGNKWVASKYQWKVYREIEGLNAPLSIYYFFHYTINGVIKTYVK